MCVFNCDVDLKLYIITLSMVSPFIICAVVPVSNFFLRQILRAVLVYLGFHLPLCNVHMIKEGTVCPQSC